MAVKLNLGIALGFVANFALTFLSQTGAYGKTNAEISQMYQSLVTPAGWAFAIWGIIFSLQTIYAVVQLAVPSYRDAEEVQRAGPWFIGTCLLQAAWSVAFGMEQIILAQVLICGILATLWRMNVQLQAVKTATSPSWFQYIVLYLPFSIHFGWLTAATAVGLNLTVVHSAPHSHVALLALAIITIVVVTLPAFIDPATGETGSNPPYALTIAWALAGVYSQLASPMDNAPKADPIKQWCPPLVSDALAAVAAVLAIAIVVFAMIRATTGCLARLVRTRSELNSGMRDSLVVGVEAGK